MADLLVSELLMSGHFTVVERGHLNTVVDEIQRQKHKLFRAEGRVGDGRLKNAGYMIRGVINDFSQVGSGSLALVLRQIVFGGRGYTARVALTLTLVDVESGQIVASVQCAGFARARETYARAGYKSVAFGGEAFFKTPLGAATVEAIRHGVGMIATTVPRVHWEARLADLAEGGTGVVVNGGADRGLKPGQLFDVHTDGQRITDPVTGDLLGVRPGRIVGRVRITTVMEAMALAEVVGGDGFVRGQRLTAVLP